MILFSICFCIQIKSFNILYLFLALPSPVLASLIPLERRYRYHYISLGAIAPVVKGMRSDAVALPVSQWYIFYTSRPSSFLALPSQVIAPSTPLEWRYRYHYISLGASAPVVKGICSNVVALPVSQWYIIYTSHPPPHFLRYRHKW